MSSLFGVLEKCLAPGENISYVELLNRMKSGGYDTNGIGMQLQRLAFRGYTSDWRGSEFVTYRVPTFDREAEGDWTDGQLRVVRREAEDVSE